MENRTFTNIKLYKDINFNERWMEEFSGGLYDIEIIGGKARIKTKSIFSDKQQSRLNKLNKIGSCGTDHLYKITVNGNKAFLRIPYNIFKPY